MFPVLESFTQRRTACLPCPTENTLKHNALLAIHSTVSIYSTDTFSAAATTYERCCGVVLCTWRFVASHEARAGPVEYNLQCFLHSDGHPATVVAPRPGKRGRRRRPGCLVISLCWPVQAPAKQWLVTWWSTLRHPAVIHHIITTRDHRVAWQVRYATTSDMWLSFRVHRCRLWRNFFISYLCKLSSHHDVGRALRNVCYCDITFLVAYS